MKRLFSVLFFSLISPTLWANNIGRSQMMNVINTLPLFSKGIDLLDPKKFQSDTITLSQYGSSDNFTFPINVSYPEGEELKAFYQTLEDSEKSVQNQFQGSLPKISRKMNPMTEIKKAPNIKWPFKQLFVFITEILDKDKDKYPLLAEIFLHHKFLPYHLYVQSWPALNFLIEKQSLTLSKLYSGKNIIEWAFFLNREKMLDHLIKKYPQLLEPNKLKSFLEKMLKQNQSEIVEWLLNQGVILKTADFNKALSQALLDGKTELASVLLKNNPEALQQLPVQKLMYQLLENYKLESAKWLHQAEIMDLKRQYLTPDNGTIPKEQARKDYMLAINQVSIYKIDTTFLINKALGGNKMEVAKWIYQWVPKALEISSAKKFVIQALKYRDFAKAEWLYQKYPRHSLPLPVARELILSALSQNDFEVAEWIYARKKTIFKEIDTNKIITQALDQSDLEKAEWLEQRVYAKFGQIDISALIRRFLIKNNLVALDWISDRILRINSNVDWEKILYQDRRLSFVDFSKRRMKFISTSDRIEGGKELLSYMLQANSFQAIQWLEQHSSARVQKEHLLESLKQANLTAGEWILNKNPEWREEIDWAELLQFSLDQSNFSLAIWLIGQGAEIKKEHLDRLISYGNLKTTDWLIKKYPKLWESVDKQKHFEQLITNGDTQTAEWLWSKGSLIVTEEHFDRAEDQPEMELWILDKIGKKTPPAEKLLSQQMIEAVSQGNMTAIVNLENRGADLNEVYGEHTPLTKAIEQRNHTLISYFMKHAKVDINILIPSTKMTAFAWALNTENWSVMTRLLKKGADPKIQNPHLSSALILVEQIENPSTKQNLIRLIRKNLCRNGFSD